MPKQNCGQIDELLVDFADDALPPADALRVKAHLAECPQCRSELHLLQHSLQLARSVWHDSAAHAPSLAARPIRAARPRIPVRIALASCIAAVALTLGWWLIPQGNVDRVAVDRVAVDRVEPGKGSLHNPRAALDHREIADDVDVEALLAREAQSARLAASARFLATQTSLKEYQEQAERYIAEAYGDTRAAGRQARKNDKL